MAIPIKGPEAFKLRLGLFEEGERCKLGKESSEQGELGLRKWRETTTFDHLYMWPTSELCVPYMRICSAHPGIGSKAQWPTPQGCCPAEKLPKSNTKS